MEGVYLSQNILCLHESNLRGKKTNFQCEKNPNKIYNKIQLTLFCYCLSVVRIYSLRQNNIYGCILYKMFRGQHCLGKLY